MSTEKHKAIARQILESYNESQQKATEVRAATFAPDFIAHFPGVPGPLNLEAFEQIVGMFAAAFQDDHIAVDDQVAEGDRVATRWTWSFTHNGEFQGIPPTGKRITITGINFERFADGKLVERWVVMDQMGMMQQLGVIPAE